MSKKIEMFFKLRTSSGTLLCKKTQYLEIWTYERKRPIFKEWNKKETQGEFKIDRNNTELMKKFGVNVMVHTVNVKKGWIGFFEPISLGKYKVEIEKIGAENLTDLKDFAEFNIPEDWKNDTDFIPKY